MGLSPMMSHYLQVKENYKDCVVFYRLGDFYEMFFDDAIKVSALLDLTLTGRDCGLEERAPMCGIPFHAADVYIAKLVSLGEKVAICEQLSPPGGKDLVVRDVVKIVTAGTVVNNELIDEKSNNFLSSVFVRKDNMSLSWVDITTGEFFVRSFSGENSISELVDALVKISPVEIISNTEAEELFREFPLVKHGVLPKFYPFTESEFNFSNAENTLKNQLKIISLTAFGLKNDEISICSAGALISYLKETQKHALINITGIKKESNDEFMMLDINAIRNLELVKTLKDGKRYGSLYWLLDKTKTSMGARKLQSWILSPLTDKNLIEYRLDAVDAFYKNTLVRQDLTDRLSSVKDIGRISGKLSNGNLLPKDCLALKNSLEILPAVKFALSGFNSSFINEIAENLLDFSNLVELLSISIAEEPPANIKDGGYIKEGFSLELDELRNIGKNSKQIIADIERRERERTGIKTLRIGYNRVFGYYIEITNSFKHLAPYDYKRRQTLAGAERYITDELKDVEVKILTAEEQAISLESRLFSEIKDKLIERIVDLKNTAEALSNLDVILALARVARDNDYVKPTICESGQTLDIVGGRHPVVETLSKQRFVPNDCILDNKENRTMILTGPNMAGKSTYMRQIALITLMAHIGSFVPCDSAQIPLTDKIFTRIGASDNLISDQSTFMVEMNETAGILANATSKSLIILDEIGRGTSTFDGLSIAWAVVEYITNKIGAKTLFATHYHELTELEGVLDGVKNYKVTVKELQGGIVFLRKIMRGGTNRSFGIEVADLAGVNKEVIESAKKILKRLEKSDIAHVKTNNTEEKVKLSETESIIKELDFNNISPMQAFNILCDLHEKLTDK